MEICAETFLIRPVDPHAQADREAVLNVYRQCEDFLALGPVATASPEMVQADFELSAKGGGIFCGIFDPHTGQMLGVVDFILAGFEGNPEAAYLELLMIGAPHRARGLGGQVVRAVEDVIRADGRARAIVAGVQVNNPQAIRFWQRMGYQIVSGPKDYPDGTTAFDLWKAI